MWFVTNNHGLGRRQATQNIFFRYRFGRAVVLVAAFVLGVRQLTIALGFGSISSSYIWQLQREVEHNGNVVCPSAEILFSNDTDKLSFAIENNVNFHQRGGNLRSIEKYLNGHEQNALKMLGIQFTPNGQHQPSDKAIEFLQNYYEKNTIKRGGYGQPLPGKYTTKHGQNSILQALFEDRWINVIEPPTLERFSAGIGPVGPECFNKIIFSEGTYEEKTLCTASKPYHGGKEKEDCHIFSIGSNDQWGFEKEVQQKLPGCVTHTFDCTLKENTPQKKPASDSVKFYPYCIGKDDSKSPYLPYKDLLGAAQTHSPPMLLKMDVEGFEYEVLDSILSSDSSLWPEQIMMEGKH